MRQKAGNGVLKTMHYAAVIALLSGLVGCQTIKQIGEHGASSPILQVGLNVATQVGLHEALKHEKPEVIITIMSLVDEFGRAIQEDGSIDWDAGRASIVKHVPQHLHLPLLTVYNIVQTEVEHFTSEHSDSQDYMKLLYSAIQGAKSGLASALAEAQAHEA